MEDKYQRITVRPHYCILFLTLFMISLVAYGQRIDYRYNEHLWNQISLAKKHVVPQTSDTMLVICTTRSFDSLSSRLFNDQIDIHHTIHYLLAVYKTEHWILYRMNSLDEAASFLHVGRDVVFYVEGMGKTFTTNLYRAAGLSVQYQVNAILFDYPSAIPSKSLLSNFRMARKNSSNIYPLYAEWLSTIEKSSVAHEQWMQGVHTTLFHHSMGNRMLERAVVSGCTANIKDSLIHTVLLNASCVNSRNHDQWVSRLNFANDIIIAYNKQDRQLKGAGLYTLRLQLGSKPRAPFASNAVYVNFNQVAGRQHNLFLNRPGGTSIPAQLHSFYDGIFHGRSVDWNDHDLFYPTKRIPGFSIR